MVNMTSASMPSRKNQKFQDPSIHPCSPDRNIIPNRNSVMMDEDSDEDEDYQIPEAEQEVCTRLLGKRFSWVSECSLTVVGNLVGLPLSA